MGNNISWAYEFRSAISLLELQAALNQARPWEWVAHDSYWYGDYLNCRPFRKVRIRIHEKGGQGGVPAALSVLSGQTEAAPPDSYTALVDMESSWRVNRAAIDRVLLPLLHCASVRNLNEIEAYD